MPQNSPGQRGLAPMSCSQTSSGDFEASKMCTGTPARLSASSVGLPCSWNVSSLLRAVSLGCRPRGLALDSRFVLPSHHQGRQDKMHSAASPHVLKVLAVGCTPGNHPAPTQCPELLDIDFFMSAMIVDDGNNSASSSRRNFCPAPIHSLPRLGVDRLMTRDQCLHIESGAQTECLCRCRVLR